ncbi:MAG: hypothetical protein IT364_10985 [Candidatus Hydrogenedentes bacterium]|nr:hypothetical protein [Candidatus Hydrogenedentota bacterium]
MDPSRASNLISEVPGMVEEWSPSSTKGFMHVGQAASVKPEAPEARGSTFSLQ